MSLMRMPLRRPAVYGAVRCYATGGPRGLLDILSDSPSATKRQPSAPQPGEKQPGVMMRMANQALAGAQDKTSREIDEFGIRNAYQKQIHRKWNPGDVYAPHDLSGPEQKKWKTGGRRTPQSDAFDTLGMNPIHNYKNFTIMSEYMTETGRIKHSRETGLRPKNQRKIAKAIRRAIGLGLMPSVHRHPLVLKYSSPARFL